jgi:hypothetical protein
MAAATLSWPGEFEALHWLIQQRAQTVSADATASAITSAACEELV